MSIFKKKKNILEESVTDSSFFLEKKDDVFHLKKTDPYYLQIQGQMALCGLPWCDFCVFLSEKNEMFVERIYFDSHLWYDDILPKLLDFLSKK